MLLFWMVAAFFFIVQNCYSACPPGTTASFTNPNDCYLFVSNSSAFIMAEGYCRQNGGHLTSVATAFDNMFLSQEASTSFQDSSESDFWIGGTNEITPGNWTWLDNTPFTYSDWAQGQPMNSTTLNCVKASITNAMWSTEDCFKSKPFVCLISLPPTTTSTMTTIITTTTTLPTTTTTMPICSYGYTYLNHTGMYYYAHVPSQYYWQDAENYCVQDHGHLASFHDQIEADFIIDVAREALSKSKGYSPCWAKQCWVGLQTLNEGNTWQWSDSSVYNFANWNPGKPDNKGKENCGMLVLSPCDSETINMMNNFDCTSSTEAFVCKKPTYTT